MSSVPGSVPDWSVDPSDYAYDGSIVADVRDNGTSVVGAGDMLGAFVEEECRGVAEAWETPGRSYLFLMSVYSNEVTGETLEFLFYDASEGSVSDVLGTIPFVSDMIVGELMNPYVFSTTLVEQSSWTSLKALFW